MSDFGLNIYSPAWGGDFNITEGWQPCTYVGEVKTKIVLGNSNKTVDFTGQVPDEMILFALPSSKIADAYYQNDQFGGYGVAYAWDCTITGKVVRITETLRHYADNASIIGRDIRFSIYGYLPPAVSEHTYGIEFKNSGVSTMMDTRILPHVARWKVEDNVGTRSGTWSYNTGVPSSEPEPSPFISDSGYNAIATYMEKSNGYWYVRVYRGNGAQRYYRGLKIPAPNSGVIRIVVFTQYDGSQGDYGLSLYGSDGSLVYSSVAPPLMLQQRSLTMPDPYIGSYNYMGDRAGDKFTAAEMAKEPMISAPLLGLARQATRYHWTCSIWVKSDGTYTVGTNRYSLENNFYGVSQGWWGPSFGDAKGEWIAGVDYF